MREKFRRDLKYIGSDLLGKGLELCRCTCTQGGDKTMDKNYLKLNI